MAAEPQFIDPVAELQRDDLRIERVVVRERAPIEHRESRLHLFECGLLRREVLESHRPDRVRGAQGVEHGLERGAARAAGGRHLGGERYAP